MPSGQVVKVKILPLVASPQHPHTVFVNRHAAQKLSHTCATIGSGFLWWCTEKRECQESCWVTPEEVPLHRTVCIVMGGQPPIRCHSADHFWSCTSQTVGFCQTGFHTHGLNVIQYSAHVCTLCMSLILYSSLCFIQDDVGPPPSSSLGVSTPQATSCGSCDHL